MTPSTAEVTVVMLGNAGRSGRSMARTEGPVRGRSPDLVREAVAHVLSVQPDQLGRDIRRCRRCGGPHGALRFEGVGLVLSLARCRAMTVMAMSSVDEDGLGIGVDVEDLPPRAPLPPPETVLSPVELRRGVPDAQALLRSWTRKEALLKATGDGLAVPMSALTLSALDERAALEHWDGDLERTPPLLPVDIVDLDAGLCAPPCPPGGASAGPPSVLGAVAVVGAARAAVRFIHWPVQELRQSGSLARAGAAGSPR